MHEIWKPVQDYEGLYEVSNFGSVRSLPRKAGNFHIKGRILKQFKSRQGYYSVCLSKDGTSKTFAVHRLVAISFVPNPENKVTVNHINEDKLDNRAENLEWLTLRENLHYGTRAARARETITESIGVPVLQISPNGHSVIKRYESISTAAESVNARPSDIFACIGSKQKCRGYYWKRVDSVSESELLFWEETGERFSAEKNRENGDIRG